jgi:hypothetical protein
MLFPSFVSGSRSVRRQGLPPNKNCTDAAKPYGCADNPDTFKPSSEEYQNDISRNGLRSSVSSVHPWVSPRREG